MRSSSRQPTVPAENVETMVTLFIIVAIQLHDGNSLVALNRPLDVIDDRVMITLNFNVIEQVKRVEHIPDSRKKIALNIDALDG